MRRTIFRDLAIRSIVTQALFCIIAVIAIFAIYNHELQADFNKDLSLILEHLKSHASFQEGQLDPDSVQEYIRLLEKDERFRYIVISQANHEMFWPPDANLSNQKFDQIRTAQIEFGNRVADFVLCFSEQQVAQRRSQFLAWLIPLAILVFFILIALDLLSSHFFYSKPMNFLFRGLDRISQGDELSYRILSGKQHDVNAIIAKINAVANRFQSNEIERQISDAKHRLLVENSKDIIFSMNEDGIIITINQALKNHLGYEPQQLKGKPFELLINQDRNRKDDFRVLLFYNKLKDLQVHGGSHNFKLEMLSAHGEPREMNLRMEYMQVFQANVFWGKLEPMSENIMGQLCTWEHRRFRIGNYLNVANTLLNTITMNLSRYFSDANVMSIKIGLREMMINAIEHGNLGISYQEKSQATSGENYLELVTERQNQKPYSERQVDIRYSLNSRRVLYIICDQGDGFDHQKMRENFRVNKELYHGRGMVIALSIFDVVKYNDLGNEVRLIKYTDRTDT